MSSDPFLLAQRSSGQIYLSRCGRFIKVRFAHVFWRLTQKEFLAFRDYIAELNTSTGFFIHEAEPGLALLALPGERQAVLLNKREILAFDQLLEQALIELARRWLEVSYNQEVAHEPY